MVVIMNLVIAAVVRNMVHSSGIFLSQTLLSNDQINTAKQGDKFTVQKCQNVNLSFHDNICLNKHLKLCSTMFS